MRYGDILDAKEIKEELKQLHSKMQQIDNDVDELSQKFVDCLIFGAECEITDSGVVVSSGGAVLNGSSFPIPQQNVGSITTNQYVILNNPRSGECTVTDSPGFRAVIAQYTGSSFDYSVREKNSGISLESSADDPSDQEEGLLSKDSNTGQLFVVDSNTVYREKQSVVLGFMGRSMSMPTEQTEVFSVPVYITYGCQVTVRAYVDTAATYNLILYDGDTLIAETGSTTLASADILSLSVNEDQGHRLYRVLIESSAAYNLNSMDILAVIE